MAKIRRHYVETVLDLWIRFVQKFPIYIVVLSMIAAIASLNYTINNLGMNTDTQDMLSPNLLWRQLDLEYEKKFPQYNDNLLIVIESTTPDQAQDAAQLLYSRLLEENVLFKTVYYPKELTFFKESALLYLDIEELEDLSDNLAAIQPFLSKLTEDQSLHGLFNMLGEAVKAKYDGEDFDITPLLRQINKALDAIEQKNNYRLSWHALLSGQDEIENKHREFIILQPVQDYSEFLPTQTAIDKVRALTNELKLDEKYNARLRLTGSTVLAHEELLSVSQGTGKAIIVALFLVAIIMLIGLGSIWLVVATLFTLITGLILTAAFATYTVGELNLISVVFAILYIGLGVDFAIHLCLRYRELLLNNQHHQSALKEATTNVGGSLILCALTTAIGFYSFMPTDYDGVAELGWISGSGMFISLIVTLTVLPALLSFFPHTIKNSKPRASIILNKLIALPTNQSKNIKIILFLITIGSLALIPKIRFDYNTLNLQSPENESVRTYLDLLEDSDTSPWTSVVLAKNKEQARYLSEKIKKFSLVDKVIWLQDFIPEQQKEKLEIIDEMNLLLGNLLVDKKNNTVSDRDKIDALQEFISILAKDDYSSPAEQDIKGSLDNFLLKLQQLNKKDQHKLLYQLEQSLLASLPGRLNALKAALNADEVEINNLPNELSARWESADGDYLLEIFPTENLMDNIAMGDFVAQLQQEIPQVIGSPVVNIEGGKAVVTAFQQAFLYALISISLLLLLLLRSVRDTIYILIPLLLAAILTGAFSVLLKIPLNFANIIALPLLLGIGVDSAIHINHRSRSAPPEDGRLLATSSARAVLVSALTTIFTIGNLAFSPHLGTASMGKLLTIGICMTLLCTLIVLPSLLNEQNKKIKSNSKLIKNDKPWDARLAYQLIYPLQNSWVTPNHLTCLRLLFGILAAVSFSSGSYFWTNIGACCFVISNFLDHADGELARLTGNMSKYGHYFDLTSDAIVNTILFIGIGIGLIQSSLGWWALPMGILAGLSIAAIFHMRYEIEKQVGKSNARQPYIAGFEAEDILYLLPLVSILNGLIPFLILASIGAPIFAIFVWREFRTINIINY